MPASRPARAAGPAEGRHADPGARDRPSDGRQGTAAARSRGPDVPGARSRLLP